MTDLSVLKGEIIVGWEGFFGRTEEQKKQEADANAGTRDDAGDHQQTRPRLVKTEALVRN
jgi:hypothetical protein